MRRRVPPFAMLAIYALTTGLLLVLFGFGVFERFDLLLFDSNYSLRAGWQPSRRVVIVGYDDATNLWVSRNNLALRDVIADVVSLAANAEAGCVAVDYAFTRTTKHDDKLAKALLLCRRLVLVCAKGEARVGKSRFEVFVDPTPAIAEVLEYEDVWAGVANVEPDGDGVLRRLDMAWLGRPVVGNKIRDEEWRLSFAAATLAATLNAQKVEVGSKEVVIHTKTGKFAIPRRCMVDFCGPPGSVERISMAEFLTEKKTKGLKNAVVFVGDVRLVGGDVYRTPASCKEAPWMAGVEFQANAFATLLEKRWFRTPPLWLQWLLFFVVAGVCLPVFYVGRRRRLWAVGFWVAGLVALLWFAQYIAFLHQVFLSVTGCMFAVLIEATGGLSWRLAFLWRRERQIVSLFGRYVSQKVVQRMVDGEVEVDLSGHTKEISVLFADIRDFTPLCEKLTAYETGRILNQFFSRMIEVVFRYDGTLDKLMGDCVMTFFNDPDEQPDHAERACRVALEMVRALDGVDIGGRALQVGVGINTGSAVVGNLGAPQFYDYTAVGDTVNLANRLQGLTREFGVDIIVGEATYKAAREQFLFRCLGVTSVKGRQEAIRIYQLLAHIEDADEALRNLVADYEKALSAFQNGQIKDALYAFEALSHRFPDDTPTRIMLQRCRNLATPAPGAPPLED